LTPLVSISAFATVSRIGILSCLFSVSGAEVALLCAKLFHTELRKDPNYQNDCRSAMQITFFRLFC
jgi:hypothetical protein